MRSSYNLTLHCADISLAVGSPIFYHYALETSILPDGLSLHAGCAPSGTKRKSHCDCNVTEDHSTSGSGLASSFPFTSDFLGCLDTAPKDVTLHYITLLIGSSGQLCRNRTSPYFKNYNNQKQQT